MKDRKLTELVPMNLRASYELTIFFFGLLVFIVVNIIQRLPIDLCVGVVWTVEHLIRSCSWVSLFFGKSLLIFGFLWFHALLFYYLWVFRI